MAGTPHRAREREGDEKIADGGMGLVVREAHLGESIAHAHQAA
jgi:hypothetical protein